MFSGEHINVTDNRCALHIALRVPREYRITVDGVHVVTEVTTTLERMAALSEEVRDARWRGYTGKQIRKMLNTGPRVQVLGTVMSYEAILSYSTSHLDS